jgi:hypothetical protein
VENASRSDDAFVVLSEIRGSALHRGCHFVNGFSEVYMPVISALRLSILLAASFATSALANSISCNMDTGPAPYYIAPVISLKVGDYEEVAVRDSIIASTGRKMVRGTVSKDDSRRISFVWEVKNVPANPSETRRYDPMLQVRLTIQKPGGGATMVISDTLYEEFVYRTTGQCTFEG